MLIVFFFNFEKQHCSAVKNNVTYRKLKSSVNAHLELPKYIFVNIFLVFNIHNGNYIFEDNQNSNSSRCPISSRTIQIMKIKTFIIFRRYHFFNEYYNNNK